MAARQRARARRRGRGHGGRALVALACGAGLGAVASAAGAQGAQGTQGAGAPEGSVAAPAPWSTERAGAGAARAGNELPSLREAPLVAYGSTPDPSTGQVFALPTARGVPAGDVHLTLGGPGPTLAGARYGVNRWLDVGVSVPLYLVGLAVDARVALWRTEGAALALYGYATSPWLPGAGPAQFAGFTFAGAGPAWLAGPVATFWGPRAALSVGLHALQRTLLLGLWGAAQASAELRVMDGVKLLLAGVVLFELAPESADGARAAALVGNLHPRVFPYLAAGVRLHARRFSIDLGPLLAVGNTTPLSTGVVGLWPWAAAVYAF